MQDDGGDLVASGEVHRRDGADALPVQDDVFWGHAIPGWGGGGGERGLLLWSGWITLSEIPRLGKGLENRYMISLALPSPCGAHLLAMAPRDRQNPPRLQNNEVLQRTSHHKHTSFV